MKAVPGLLLALSAAASAAEPSWRLEDGVARAAPSGGNSNILQIEIGCGDPYRFAVYAQHGAVLPASGIGKADYFYRPGRIEAEIDGLFFLLAAAGSDDAIVLLSEGTAAQSYLADLDEGFVATLQEGRLLTVSFDVTPEPNAETDSPFETFARFPLEGAGEAIGQALSSCTPS